jgi:hypothetical protein
LQPLEPVRLDSSQVDRLELRLEPALLEPARIESARIEAARIERLEPVWLDLYRSQPVPACEERQ